MEKSLVEVAGPLKNLGQYQMKCVCIILKIVVFLAEISLQIMVFCSKLRIKKKHPACRCRKTTVKDIELMIENNEEN